MRLEYRPDVLPPALSLLDAIWWAGVIGGAALVAAWEGPALGGSFFLGGLLFHGFCALASFLFRASGFVLSAARAARLGKNTNTGSQRGVPSASEARAGDCREGIDDEPMLPGVCS